MALTTFARGEKADAKFLQLITALHERASQRPKRRHLR